LQKTVNEGKVGIITCLQVNQQGEPHTHFLLSQKQPSHAKVNPCVMSGHDSIARVISQTKKEKEEHGYPDPKHKCEKHRNVLTEKLYKIYIQPQRVVVAVVQ